MTTSHLTNKQCQWYVGDIGQVCGKDARTVQWTNDPEDSAGLCDEHIAKFNATRKGYGLEPVKVTY